MIDADVYTTPLFFSRLFLIARRGRATLERAKHSVYDLYSPAMPVLLYSFTLTFAKSCPHPFPPTLPNYFISPPVFNGPPINELPTLIYMLRNCTTLCIYYIRLLHHAFNFAWSTTATTHTSRDAPIGRPTKLNNSTCTVSHCFG